jgi:hypothetical protein
LVRAYARFSVKQIMPHVDDAPMRVVQMGAQLFDTD